jgi:hypothetical protein
MKGRGRARRCCAWSALASPATGVPKDSWLTIQMLHPGLVQACKGLVHLGGFGCPPDTVARVVHCMHIALREIGVKIAPSAGRQASRQASW